MKVGFMDCKFGEQSEWSDFTVFGFASSQSLLDFDLVLWNVWSLMFDYRSTNSIRHGEPENHLYTTDEFQRIIRDRARRLREIEWLMRSGRTLVILCPSPSAFSMKLSAPSDSKVLMYEDDYFIDPYSFLPRSIGEQIRRCAVDAWGNEMELRDEEAFSDFWDSIQGVAWYSAYLTSQIGKPFLYAKGTPYPTATWFKYEQGNIFLIPGIGHDGVDDHGNFVEAAKHLVTAANLLSSNLDSFEADGIFQPVQEAKSYSELEQTVENQRWRGWVSVLRTRFNESELKDVYFELGLEYGSLESGGKNDQARALVDYYRRRGQLSELRSAIIKIRPDISLP
jgi:hypothetical protein